jgi:hypothetical protein
MTGRWMYVKEDDEGGTPDEVGRFYINTNHCKGDVWDLGYASGWSAIHRAYGYKYDSSTDDDNDTISWVDYKLWCNSCGGAAAPAASNNYLGCTYGVDATTAYPPLGSCQGDDNPFAAGTTSGEAPSGYCGGRCGGNAGTCWCDSACTSYGDCCPDYATSCTTSGTECAIGYTDDSTHGIGY